MGKKYLPKEILTRNVEIDKKPPLHFDQYLTTEPDKQKLLGCQ